MTQKDMDEAGDDPDKIVDKVRRRPPSRASRLSSASIK